MSDYVEELWMELAKLAQKRYNHMNEVFRLTKDIADGLSRDDKVSVQMLLGMRGEELEAIKGCDGTTDLLLEGADTVLREQAYKLLKGNSSGESTESELVKKIAGIVLNTKNVWKQTLVIDKRISCRLAGKDSFYQ